MLRSNRDKIDSKRRVLETNQHKALWFAAKILMTILLLGAVIYGLDVQKISDSLQRLNPLATLAGGVAASLFVAMRIAKWKRLVVTNGIHVTTLVLAKAMMYSLVLGIITPGRLGEMISVAPFPSEQRKKGILLFLLDKAGDVATVLMLSAPAAVMLMGHWGLLIGPSLLAPYFSMMILFGRRQYWQYSITRLPSKLARYTQRLKAQTLQTDGVYWIASVLGQLSAYLMVTCFIKGAMDVDGWAFVLLLPVVSLSNLISITVGGLGVREGLAALLLPLTGVPSEVGAVAFLLAFIMTRVIPGMAGALWYTVSPTMRVTQRH